MHSGQASPQIGIMRSLCAEQWSNSACCGYATIACKALGYTDEQARAFIDALNTAFGNCSVESAKRKFEQGHGTSIFCE